MSILKRLEEARIFSLERADETQFEVCERCDGYFHELLTADELRALAQEILAIANGEVEMAVPNRAQWSELTIKDITAEAVRLWRLKNRL